MSNFLIYLALRLLVCVLQGLSFPAACGVARFLAWAAYHLDKRHRLVAQENLRANSDFQSRTIQRLTSGYRINSSGDDAAGLAVANQFRSATAELSQGVRNANDGLSQLQIADGGMSNISQLLDRARTLASQSASDTTLPATIAVR